MALRSGGVQVNINGERLMVTSSLWQRNGGGGLANPGPSHHQNFGLGSNPGHRRKGRKLYLRFISLCDMSNTYGFKVKPEMGLYLRFISPEWA